MFCPLLDCHFRRSCIWTITLHGLAYETTSLANYTCQARIQTCIQAFRTTSPTVEGSCTVGTTLQLVDRPGPGSKADESGNASPKTRRTAQPGQPTEHFVKFTNSKFQPHLSKQSAQPCHLFGRMLVFLASLDLERLMLGRIASYRVCLLSIFGPTPA